MGAVGANICIYTTLLCAFEVAFFHTSEIRHSRFFTFFKSNVLNHLKRSLVQTFHFCTQFFENNKTSKTMDEGFFLKNKYQKSV